MQTAVKTIKPQSHPDLAVQTHITGNSLEVELISNVLEGLNDSSVWPLAGRYLPSIRIKRALTDRFFFTKTLYHAIHNKCK